MMWQARSTGTVALLALTLTLALGSVGDARSQTVVTPYIPRAMAENGAIVMMPAIDDLDCAAIEQVLRRIDLSNYRSPEPLHVGHPDWLIFDYEDAVAAKYYLSCIMTENRLEDPGPAFSLGFESQ